MNTFVDWYQEFLPWRFDSWEGGVVSILLALFVAFIIFIVFLGIVSGIAWLCTRYSYSRDLKVIAKVVDLSYSPRRTRTGYGPVIGGKGGVAVTTSTDAEEHNVVLRSSIFPKIVINDEELFNAVEQGQEVEFCYRERHARYFWEDESDSRFEAIVPLRVAGVRVQ